MVSAIIKDELLSRIDQLPVELQRRVIAFADALVLSNPKGTPGRDLLRFAGSVSVLGCEHETSRRYGALKRDLERHGRLIPENDIWIAATALQHGRTLVTRDAHFEVVEELDRVQW